MCLLDTAVDDISDKGDTANIGVDQSLTLAIPPDTFSVTGGRSLKILLNAITGNF